MVTGFVGIIVAVYGNKNNTPYLRTSGILDFVSFWTFLVHYVIISKNIRLHPHFCAVVLGPKVAHEIIKKKEKRPPPPPKKKNNNNNNNKKTSATCEKYVWKSILHTFKIYLKMSFLGYSSEFRRLFREGPWERAKKGLGVQAKYRPYSVAVAQVNSTCYLCKQYTSTWYKLLLKLL